MIFVWPLTLHPAASGRVYAAYGAGLYCYYAGLAMGVDGIAPTWSDIVGVGLALCGVAVIAMGQRPVSQ